MKAMLRRLSLLSLGCAVACGQFGVTTSEVRAQQQQQSPQYSEQFVISAKAGGVNLISGRVAVRRKDSTEWQPLVSQTEEPPAEKQEEKRKDRDKLFRERETLNSGDSVRTEDTGRLEALLNPGSYLRLAENSEMEFIDASLDNLRVKLVKGTAIIEATGGGGVKMLTEVVTPQTKIAIVKTGLYRVNVTASGGTELFVRKGEARVGTDTLVTVKGGKKAFATGGVAEVAKFDKKMEDSFDFWSKSRAETLIAANGRLSGRLADAIYNSGYRPLRTGTGLWVYDPFLQSSTFFPFYTGWNSPYGRGYQSSFGYSASDWYRPNPSYYPGSPNYGATPNAPNPNPPAPDAGGNLRDRKERVSDELPARPPADSGMGRGRDRGDGFEGSPRGGYEGGHRPPQNEAPQHHETPQHHEAPQQHSAPPPSYSPPPQPSYSPPSPSQSDSHHRQDVPQIQP